jgi:hypothetical protein
MKRYARDYMMALKPVIVTGGFDHWPARTKWTLAFFKESYGHLQVEVDGKTYAMAEIIDKVEKSTPENPAPYLRNHLVNRLPQELQDDIQPMPQCTRPNWLEHPLMRIRGALTFIELYIGGRGAKFPVLHYDGLHTHAFLMQLVGVKEYIVFAPDQTPFMYPSKLSPSATNSEVNDVDTPDVSRFPKFAEAQGMRFKLHPGETLFVPSGWWHTARILSPSITVSINGVNAANWSAFSSDFSNVYMAGRRMKAALAHAYLTLVGAYIGLREASWLTDLL